MSFSFVVEGNALDKNMDGEQEKQAVQDAVTAMFKSGTSAQLFMRVGSFNPPSWAPTKQDTESLDDTEPDTGSLGDTGEGVLQTPTGPEGEQTASSA